MGNPQHSYKWLISSIVRVTNTNNKRIVVTCNQSRDFEINARKEIRESILPESKLERKVIFACALLSANEYNWRG